MVEKTALSQNKFVPIAIIVAMGVLILFAYTAISNSMAKSNLTQILREE